MLESFGDHRIPFEGDRGIQFEFSEMSRLEDIIEWERSRAWALTHYAHHYY
jgi:hypothetical protein